MLGPIFFAFTVKVTLLPTLGVELLTVFVTAKSAILFCVFVSEAELLLEFGSGTCTGELTVAVFIRFPVKLDGTDKFTV